jgi:hypothetical protein
MAWASEPRGSAGFYVLTRARTWSLILSYMNPVYTLKSGLILSSNLSLDLPNGHLPVGFPTRILYAYLISPLCVTCPAHLIILDLITLIIFDEVYNLWSTSSLIILQAAAASSLLSPNVRNGNHFSEAADFHSLDLPHCITSRNSVMDTGSDTGVFMFSLEFALLLPLSLLLFAPRIIHS